MPMTAAMARTCSLDHAHILASRQTLGGGRPKSTTESPQRQVHQEIQTMYAMQYFPLPFIIRSCRMHDTRTIAIDVPGVFSLSVCLSASRELCKDG